MVRSKKKLTKHPATVNEVSRAEFSRIEGVSKPMVNKWEKAGRLVFTADGKRVLVNESRQRLKDTAPLSGHINRIHSANRKKTENDSKPEIQFTELKDKVNESQLDLETKNAKELFENSRALKEKSAALQAAAEYEAYIGSLMDKKAAEKIIFERGRQFRDGLMSLSRKLAPEIAGNPNITEVEGILNSEFRLILENFANLPPVE